jgi:single-stranded DNA-binding protein
MNSVNLVGRLSRAPTVRFEGESQTATFTLAIQEPSREGKPYTLYVPCTSLGRSAKACSLLNAADLVSVQGKLTWRKHAAQNSQTHSQLVVSVREVQALKAAAEEPV